MSITTKDDMYNAIRGYKYQHCPVLSGLNKTQLGQLVNKFDLNVEPTGKRERATGTGAGRNWNVARRTKPTWKTKATRTRDGVRYTGLLEKTKPVQEKREEVERAVDERRAEINRMRDLELARVREAREGPMRKIKIKKKKKPADKVKGDILAKISRRAREKPPPEEPKPKKKKKKKLRVFDIDKGIVD